MRQTSFIILLLLLTACSDKKETTIPKPLGYMRVNLPEHQYEMLDSSCHYIFEKSILTSLETPQPEKPCNRNLVYDRFNAKVHLSYIAIDSNKTLFKLIEDSRNFAYGHQVKASAIKTEMVFNPQKNVSGLKYEITGDAASPLQFYITDSTQHFLRGALYFNTTPNYDSLRPYINFIHTDMRKLIETLEWRE